MLTDAARRDTPSGPWIMLQRWHDLLFAHWPLSPEALRPLLPAGLPLDTYDGQAWLGVVPFRMTGIRVRGAPAAPWLSAFAELNVRTYVVRDGRPGVFFFSLDAANPVAVALARRWYHLPYFRARMACTAGGRTIHYRSLRTHRDAPAARFVAHYRPDGPPLAAVAGSLADWLTARFCLYTAGGSGRLYRADIDHQPWPLQPAVADIRVNTMTAGHGIALPETPPLLHFSRRLDVTVWPLRRLAGEPGSRLS